MIRCGPCSKLDCRDPKTPNVCFEIITPHLWKQKSYSVFTESESDTVKYLKHAVCSHKNEAHYCSKRGKGQTVLRMSMGSFTIFPSLFLIQEPEPFHQFKSYIIDKFKSQSYVYIRAADVGFLKKSLYSVK